MSITAMTAEGQLPVVIFVGSTPFHLVKRGDQISKEFAGAVYIKGKCAIFTEPSGEPRVALINNKKTPRTGPFFVSCSALPEGRIRYMYGISSLDEEFLGISGLGYLAEKELALKVSRELGLHPREPNSSRPRL